jgi:hypothetical protein
MRLLIGQSWNCTGAASVPLNSEDANKTVRVVVESLDEAEPPATRPTTREE